MRASNARAMGHAISRIAPNLRRLGVKVETTRQPKKRTHKLTFTGDKKDNDA